jgi:hypothetical protein
VLVWTDDENCVRDVVVRAAVEEELVDAEDELADVEEDVDFDPPE